MRLICSMLAFALVAVMPVAAIAADQDFAVVNKTGYPIDSIFVSETGNRHWGDDVMGQDTLDVGETVNITFSHHVEKCHWDMMVKYHDGDSATWNNLDLCDISKVSLYWNQKTQTTTARTE